MRLPALLAMLCAACSSPMGADAGSLVDTGAGLVPDAEVTPPDREPLCAGGGSVDNYACENPGLHVHCGAPTADTLWVSVCTFGGDWLVDCRAGVPTRACPTCAGDAPEVCADGSLPICVPIPRPCDGEYRN